MNGRVAIDPEAPVHRELDQIEVDGRATIGADRVVVMLNKPRGLVTTVSDEQGRDTVYRCLAGAALPWLAPVGRLDKASEGLLLFTNDSMWAARLTEPSQKLDKTYHVQINRVATASWLDALQRGVHDAGEALTAKSVRLLRSGGKNSWLEVILEQGKNRHIRRLLGALDTTVLRLVRVGLGTLVLGELAKGQWRRLTDQEIDAL